jgi:integral membrane sensor domain MASE1
MSQSPQVVLLVLLALLAANLPFVNQRLLVLGPVRQPKPLAWRLLELVLLYFVVGGIGLALENNVGQIAPQGWEFYAITGTMFLTLAFPGFVYRYLAHRRD